MCTVTMIPHGDGRLRVACNRDEQRTRPRAAPPDDLVVGSRRALLPRDTSSGGTWIAVNDAGLVMTLLNANPGTDVASPVHGRSSRGEIIMQLLGAETLQEASALARGIDASRHAPFRLFVVEGRTVADLEPGLRGVDVVRIGRVEAPRMETGSGLGDHIVEPPRRALFAQMFRDAAPDDYGTIQDRFHRHRRPDQPHLGVDMDRADAETVSLTVIEPVDDGVTMRYVAGHPSADPTEIVRTLPYRRPVRP